MTAVIYRSHTPILLRCVSTDGRLGTKVSWRPVTRSQGKTKEAGSKPSSIIREHNLQHPQFRRRRRETPQEGSAGGGGRRGGSGRGSATEYATIAGGERGSSRRILLAGCASWLGLSLGAQDPGVAPPTLTLLTPPAAQAADVASFVSLDAVVAQVRAAAAELTLIQEAGGVYND